MVSSRWYARNWNRSRYGRADSVMDSHTTSPGFKTRLVRYFLSSFRMTTALCLYSVTGWGVMSCVCGMAFLCGSTLVKVSLLQAGTVAIWPKMFQRDVKPKQTNKQTNKTRNWASTRLHNIWTSIRPCFTLTLHELSQHTAGSIFYDYYDLVSKSLGDIGGQKI